MKFNAPKTPVLLALVMGLLMPSLPAHSAESDFPTSCQLSTEEREEEMEESRLRRASKYLLSEMPSVIDDCAFGQRLQDAIGGLIGKLFDKIPSFNSLDGDFFCGFGAQDAWRVGATAADYEGARDYATWFNDTKKNANKEAKAMSRQVPGQVQLSDESENDNWNRDNVFNRVWDWMDDDENGEN